jgi:hypothetical protein
MDDDLVLRPYMVAPIQWPDPEALCEFDGVPGPGRVRERASIHM